MVALTENLPKRTEEQPERILLSRDYLVQGFIASSLSATMGSSFVLGSFNLPIERAAYPPHSLDGVWPRAIFLTCLFYSPISVVAGIILSTVSESEKPKLNRRLALIGAAAYPLFSLTAIGVMHSEPYLLQIGAAVFGVPLGLHTVASVEHLLRWFAHAPEFAAMLSSLSFAVGMIIFSWVFDLLCQRLAVEHAILFASFILSLSGFIFSLLLRQPSELCSSPSSENDSYNRTGDRSNADEVLNDENNRLPLLVAQEEFPTLKITEALKVRSFWLFFFSVFSASGGQALITYYHALGAAFEQDEDLVNSSFQLGNVVSLLGCVIVPPLCSRMRKSHGKFRLGARNAMFMLLLTMTVTCATLSYTARGKGDFNAIVVGSASAKLIFHALYGIAPVLAVELFGLRNSALSYGVAAGLAFGSGEAASIGLMSLVQAYEPSALGVARYTPFYNLVAVWGTLGMISIIFMRQHNVSILNSRLNC